MHCKALLISVLVVPFLVSIGATAQPWEDERILLPIAFPGYEGANGTRWRTGIAVFSPNTEFVNVTQHVPELDCVLPCGGPSGGRGFFVVEASGFPGAFVYVRKTTLPLTWDYRLYNVANGYVDEGVRLPIVREREMFSGPLNLLSFPVTSVSRSAIRVYDFDARVDSSVRMKIYKVFGPDPLVVDEVLTLVRRGRQELPNYPSQPSQIQITDLLARFPELALLDPRQRLRVEIEPITPGLRFWAFGSITHNTTQAVTLIVP